MNFSRSRFSFLRWYLQPLRECVTRTPEDPLLEEHLAKSRFSVRLLRYWWAAQAIREEAKRRGGRVTIVDYGAGRGWLKRFVGEDIDAHWIALDWQPNTTLLEKAGYHEIHGCNFDHPLPLPLGGADIAAALHVFEHLPRPAFSLNEIGRILGAAGCLVAGTPTMPSLFARWRQNSFRRKLARNRIARGGHINSLSPGRWRSLLEDCGFGVDFITGSHLVRHTGNPLENSRLWIRFNQLWGAAFPSLGSEACLRARKTEASPESSRWEPELLTRGNRHRPRLALAGVGLAVTLTAAAILFVAQETMEAHVDKVLTAQLSLEAEHFHVVQHPALEDFERRQDVSVIRDFKSIESQLSKFPQDTHVLLHEDHFGAIKKQAKNYVIDSRIDARYHDFYLIRKGEDGTGLDHFLSHKN